MVYFPYMTELLQEAIEALLQWPEDTQDKAAKAVLEFLSFQIEAPTGEVAA